MRTGSEKVSPPSSERTSRYWLLPRVLKFSNATYSLPFLGSTTGTENWSSSQAGGSSSPNCGWQKLAEVPEISVGVDQCLPWSSE
jgi:hypothetical protein